MPSIPKTPCPVGGQVPWASGLWPIVARKPHPVLIWLYTIHERRPEAGLIIWCNVSQEDIVREMELAARFKVGEAVQLGTFNVRRILGRKWDFERGQFNLVIEGTRPGHNLVLAEDDVERRIKSVREEHA